LVAPALAATHTNVTIVGHAFQPQTVTVVAGESVTWRNDDPVTHNAVAFDGSFRTEVLSTGQTGSVTFTAVGSFSYRCTIHPSMRGAVDVVASAPAPATDAEGAPAQPAPSPAFAMVASMAAAGAVWALVRRTRRRINLRASTSAKE
jgi:hypothetical protein